MSVGERNEERGGAVFLEVFAHPGGVVDRPSYVKGVTGGKIGTGTLPCTDPARAYSAYVKGNPGLRLYRCRVNHSTAGEEGFTWSLDMDAADGLEFKEPPGGYMVLPVSAQMADGAMGKLETQLH